MRILRRISRFAAVLALVATSSAMAAPVCTDLGVVGPPALRLFGNQFTSVQHFEDCYNFTIDGPANAFAFTIEFDGSAPRDIDLDTFTLTGGDLANPFVDATPSNITIENLLAGAYQFVLSGDVTGRNGGFLGGGLVGYSGAFTTTVASQHSVPEPNTITLLAMGLLLMGWGLSTRRAL